MFGLNEWLAAHGGSIPLALLAAFLLGLRHATDPDHLTAVSTLVMSDRRQGVQRAGRLGLCWGLGHATTLVAFGLPVVLLGRYLPEAVQRGAEVAIGVLIVVLAVRLLLRWRRGYFHAHPHRHGDLRHSHPHLHEHAPSRGHPVPHPHRHGETLGRSPLAAFGIGLVHGVGGSAGAGILLVAAVPGRSAAVAALILFAAATALSMAIVSSAFGRVLGRGMAGHRLEALVPAFGTASLIFGVWYAAAAL